MQLNRLEADLGHPLFERAERGTAMKLTRFGKRVAAAAQKIPVRKCHDGERKHPSKP
ncbi:LysR family transcriptional regulator [Streptomyces sp. NBC_01443]|uniref:LysR family transcriptional regulator n=1 Tax=Streptomyces sp. NBC_01443 TaxID=2903868 RepID=UPI00338F2F59